MKADQAASLVEMTAAKCSTVKYDVELAEEYIARQVIFTILTDTQYTMASHKYIFNDNWSFICLFINFFLFQISTFSTVDPNVIIPLHQLPSLQAIYTLDAVISKVQVSLDEHLSKVSIEAGTPKSSEITKNLLPATLQLTDVYTAFTRWKKSHSDICNLVNQLHRLVYILSYLPVVGLIMCMWDKWSVMTLSSLLISNI